MTDIATVKARVLTFFKNLRPGKLQEDLEKEMGLIEAHIIKLQAERDAALSDALQWRAYKARKDAVLAAGMGKRPLR